MLTFALEEIKKSGFIDRRAKDNLASRMKDRRSRIEREKWAA